MFDGLYVNTADLLRFVTTISVSVLLANAAYRDVRYRLIPNKLTALIAILGVAHLFVVDDLLFGVGTLAAAFLILLVTFLLFAGRIIGGGDVKLLTATVLVIGYRDLYSFLVIMAICGALLAIPVIIMRSPLPLYLGSRLGSIIATTKPSVPYGVAIAAGAIATLFLPIFNIG